jgi:hypothetical protein
MMWKDVVAACIAVGLMMSVVPGSLAEDAPEEGPYATANQWSGFLSCAVSTPIVATQACALIDENDDFIHHFTADEDLRTVVLALTWDEQILGAQELSLLFEEAGTNLGEDAIGSATGGSPIELRLDAGVHFDGNEQAWDLQMRVFPSFQPQVVWQQAFTVHYHLFYGAHAPEDWSAVPQ